MYNDYVQCDNVERSNGCLLFILDSRVEVIIRPDLSTIFFVSCEDNYIGLIVSVSASELPDTLSAIHLPVRLDSSNKS